MNKFYCPECKTELNKSDVRAGIDLIKKDKGHFCNKSKYYCIKHTPPVEVKEV